MKARVSFPCVVIGPISNGAREQAAIITRVWDAHDTEQGPVCINATMFMDGGGDPVHQGSLYLYDSKEAAEASTINHRKAYWAANS